MEGGGETGSLGFGGNNERYCRFRNSTVMMQKKDEEKTSVRQSRLVSQDFALSSKEDWGSEARREEEKRGQ